MRGRRPQHPKMEAYGPREKGRGVLRRAGRVFPKHHRRYARADAPHLFNRFYLRIRRGPPSFNHDRRYRRASLSNASQQTGDVRVMGRDFALNAESDSTTPPPPREGERPGELRLSSGSPSRSTPGLFG